MSLKEGAAFLGPSRLAVRWTLVCSSLSKCGFFSISPESDPNHGVWEGTVGWMFLVEQELPGFLWLNSLFIWTRAMQCWFSGVQKYVQLTYLRSSKEAVTAQHFWPVICINVCGLPRFLLNVNENIEFAPKHQKFGEESGMKFSSNITGSLNVDTRQAGGGLQTIMNWHLFFTEGVTKVHQSAAAEPILDCKSANELANPYSWVDATESAYFLICKYKTCEPAALTTLAHCSRPPCNTCSVVHDALVRVSNRPAWFLTWRKCQIFEYPFLSIDKKMEKKPKQTLINIENLIRGIPQTASDGLFVIIWSALSMIL